MNILDKMYCVRFICSWFVICFLTRIINADYSCLCNYQVETPVFGVQDASTSPVGYMYEFDCKPLATPNGLTTGWSAIMNENKIAFVRKGDGLNLQVCQGSVPSEDKVTTRPVNNLASTLMPIVTSTVAVTTRIASTTTTTVKVSIPVDTTPTTQTSFTTTPSTTTKAITTQTPTSVMANITTAGISTTMSKSATTMLKSTTSLSQTLSTLAQTKTSSSMKPISSVQYLHTTPEKGNLSLCPTDVTMTTDARWIRQYKDFCYEIVSNRYEDWYDALNDCHSKDGTLVEIYTDDIQQFLVQFQKEEGYIHPMWIGLQDVDKEETFDHWETDTPLTYGNFDPNRKNNYANHAQENCVLLEPSGFWDDSVCDDVEAEQAERDGHPGLPFRHSWICQYTTTKRQTTTLPTLASTALITDVTGDLQLCPRVVTDSTDPSLIRQYKQYCYELVPRYGDWYEANQYCHDRGNGLNGLLIEIYTQDIQQFITKVLSDEGYTHPVWIGLQDVDKEESFDHWESDTHLTYSNFDPNRKDNYANHAQENCVLLEPSGFWDDSVCDDVEANQAEKDGHPGLPFRHSWICQYPIHQTQIIG
ncbi:uncharacterized protein LOC123526268 isoform X3 [Mercenaria mercenaria]|uniref:uncharacterized protein LOC123526268 isoform X3 n=1 Tax=Mercenaria mercenaria TaxID=6596 RepID=UPI00234F30BB|nr:uncharacterized protein LOC123526268 isoform X3 [Mercenaria mercenaria]